MTGYRYAGSSTLILYSPGYYAKNNELRWWVLDTRIFIAYYVASSWCSHWVLYSPQTPNGPKSAALMSSSSLHSSGKRNIYDFLSYFPEGSIYSALCRHFITTAANDRKNSLKAWKNMNDDSQFSHFQEWWKESSLWCFALSPFDGFGWFSVMVVTTAQLELIWFFAEMGRRRGVDYFFLWLSTMNSSFLKK